MARPTKDPAGKRKQVAVRFGPQELQRLEELAEEASADGEKMSVGRLIESRISALLSADNKTFALLSDIAAEIENAEDMMAKVAEDGARKAWHEDLHTWGAVAQMLASGPIDNHRPETIYGDGDYSAAQRGLYRITQDKLAVIERLSIYGVTASVEPQMEIPNTVRRGIFGATKNQARVIDRRANERATIDAITDDATREKALELHGKLLTLDQEAADESEQVADVIRIYSDMEEIGRAHYRKEKFNRLLDSIKAMPPLQAKAR